jgi:hypothetical protein
LFTDYQLTVFVSSQTVGVAAGLPVILHYCIGLQPQNTIGRDIAKKKASFLKDPDGSLRKLKSANDPFRKRTLAKEAFERL